MAEFDNTAAGSNNLDFVEYSNTNVLFSNISPVSKTPTDNSFSNTGATSNTPTSVSFVSDEADDNTPTDNSFSNTGATAKSVTDNSFSNTGATNNTPANQAFSDSTTGSNTPPSTSFEDDEAEANVVNGEVAPVLGGTIPEVVTSQAHTAPIVAGNNYAVNVITRAANVTITLPDPPSADQIIEIRDASLQAATFRITVDPGTKEIDGSTADYVMNVNGQVLKLAYVAAETSWKII